MPQLPYSIPPACGDLAGVSHSAQWDPSLRNHWDSPRIMYKGPSVPILSNVTSGMLEKKGLENLSRNIPSIASACVTWQNFPNANPLNNDLKPFLRFGNCLFFPLIPEDREHIHMGEAILNILIHQNTGLSMLVFFGLWLSLKWVFVQRGEAVSDSSPLSYLSCPALGSSRADRGTHLGLGENAGDKPCWALPSTNILIVAIPKPFLVFFPKTESGERDFHCGRKFEVVH